METSHPSDLGTRDPRTGIYFANPSGQDNIRALDTDTRHGHYLPFFLLPQERVERNLALAAATF